MASGAFHGDFDCKHYYDDEGSEEEEEEEEESNDDEESDDYEMEGFSTNLDNQENYPGEWLPTVFDLLEEIKRGQRERKQENKIFLQRPQVLRVTFDRSIIPQWRPTLIDPKPISDESDEDVYEQKLADRKEEEKRLHILRRCTTRESTVEYVSTNPADWQQELNDRFSKFIYEHPEEPPVETPDPIEESKDIQEKSFVSMEEVMEENLKNLGLSEELHRVVLVYTFRDPTSKAPLVQLLKEYTSEVNNEELGERLSGLVFHYKGVGVILVEGGQLPLMVFLRDLRENFPVKRIVHCRVIGVQQHSGPRMFGSLYTASGESPTQIDTNIIRISWHRTVQAKKVVMIGEKLRFLWTYSSTYIIEKNLNSDSTIEIPDWLNIKIPSIEELHYCSKCSLLQTVEDYVRSLCTVNDVTETFEQLENPITHLVPMDILDFGTKQEMKELHVDVQGLNVDENKILKPRVQVVYTPKDQPHQLTL